MPWPIPAEAGEAFAKRKSTSYIHTYTSIRARAATQGSGLWHASENPSYIQHASAVGLLAVSVAGGRHVGSH